VALKIIGSKGLDWIALAQDEEKWGDVVNTLMNIRISF
jgi:hypothetical protein